MNPLMQVHTRSLRHDVLADPGSEDETPVATRKRPQRKIKRKATRLVEDEEDEDEVSDEVWILN